MLFEDAARWVFGLTDYEKAPAVLYAPSRFDLRRMEALLAHLGSPHHGPVTVHIAGTKGKGSTAAMTASMLVAAGYQTGLYISPHLLSPCERVQVNGAPISRQEFASYATRLRPLVEAMNREAQFGELTTFEVLTALAFLHFHAQGVEAQVLETGMGGRLDATNVCRPSICVITSLSLDHTEVLGSTLAQIASEKAGIIKQGTPVVSAPQAPEALEMLRSACRARGAPLVVVGQHIQFCRETATLNGQAFSITTPQATHHLQLPLLGAFQIENAACALTAVELLNQGVLPHPVSREAIARGLAQVHWPGRLQVLSRAPTIVLDGAHNPYSMGRLREAVEDAFSFTRVILIIGASANKDCDGMARELAHLHPEVIITRSSHPRSAPPEALVELFVNLGLQTRSTSSVQDAMRLALQHASPDDLVLVTGSLFVVAEALAWWQEGAAR